MRPCQDESSPATPFPEAERVDTWKEVAAHLGRSVRTVQRWEREEALPIHRHLHEKLGSIYAFKPELDNWWRTRGAVLEGSGRGSSAPDTRSASSSARWQHPRIVVAGIVVAVLVLVALAAVRPPVVAAPSDEEVRWALVAEIEDLIGDEPLAERIHHALEHELRSSVVHVVPRDRIESGLRLMKRPVDSAVESDVARELAIRDGLIAALVTARLEKVESEFVVSVRMLAPFDGSSVATFSVKSAAPGPLVDGVRQQTVRARAAIARLAAHLRPRLERVTTSSLAALELYSQAVVRMDQVPVDAGPAYKLLAEAIRRDPTFASAAILAAWALRNDGRSPGVYLPYARQAMDHLEAVSEVERYFILGSFHQMTLALEEAISAYEALLALEPTSTSYWSLGNLGRLYQGTGRYGRAVEIRRRQLQMRPQQFWGVASLAEALLLQGDLAAVRRYAAQASDLAAGFHSGELSNRRSWLQLLPSCEAWLTNDVAASTRLTEGLEQQIGKQSGADRDAMALGLGYVFLTLGQVGSAERLFSRLPRAQGRDYHLAAAAASRGDVDRVLTHAGTLVDAATPSTMMFGLPILDRRLLPLSRELLRRSSTDNVKPDAELLRGQIAVIEGRPHEAIPILGASIEQREDRFTAPALAARLALAQAWTRIGDWQQAIHVLEEASQHRARSCLWPAASGQIWLNIRADLAELYRRVGRIADARTIEAELEKLMSSADSDHTLVRRLASDDRSH